MKFSRKTREEIFFIVLFLASAPLLYILFFGSGSFLELRDYNAELERIAIDNARLQEENARISRQIQRLKNDPHEIERIAREKYNLARPGDVIVSLPDGNP